MSRFALRPNFRQEISLERDAVQERIARFLSREAAEFEVKSFPGFMCLRLPDSQRHFWTPRLNLSFDEEEEGKTVINGIYGPNSHVWGMFLYGYLFFGFLALVGLIVGVSQWVIEKTPTAFWLFVPAVAGLIGIYVSGQIGRKIGAPQTLRLHRAYQKAVGEKISIR